MLENPSIFIIYGLIIITCLLTLVGLNLVALCTAFAFSMLYILYSSGRIGGVDTPYYRLTFGSEELCAQYEYAFRFICGYDYSVGFSIIFFISSILALSFVSKKTHGIKEFSLALLILFPLYFVVVDMGYLRQSLAISFAYLFCFNQPKRSYRMLGYAIAPMFHLPSLFLVFFFELWYSKRKINIFLIISSLSILLAGIYMYSIWSNSGLLELFKKDFSLASMMQLFFFGALIFLASKELEWNNRLILFVVLTCGLGYFGHFYRLFLYLIPAIALGVSFYLAKRRSLVCYTIICCLIIFGLAKLSSTVYEFEGAFDIPYSSNELFWFL